MTVKCAECQCVPEECLNVSASQHCPNCTKEICCCIIIHHNNSTKTTMKPLPRMDDNDGSCCFYGVCKNDDSNNIATAKLRTTNGKSIYEFFRHVKSLYAAALGIEILCITAAEIGENTGLYILGFNHIGIPIAYAMGLCNGLWPCYFHYFCNNSWPI
jgi:hypothetical protein